MSSSSILTNSSAMAALQTLRSISEQLDSTQNQISSGMKVASASDNAAYWSIATTMRSDNKALSAVSDSLGLGASTVDVAYTALNSTVNTLDDIKSRLVTAKQPGVDKSKIQSEIKQLAEQLKNTADSASFSGSNWLSTAIADMTDSSQTTQQIVGSFSRDSSGSITIGTINVNISQTTLFNTSGGGLLQQGGSLGGLDGTQTAIAAVDTVSGAGVSFAYPTGGFSLTANQTASFQIAVDGGQAQTVTISQQTIDTALGAANSTVSNEADMASVLTQALSDAGVTGVTATSAAGTVSLTSNNTSAATSSLSVTGVTSNRASFDIATLDISSATSAQLDTYIKGVDAMIGSVTTAASDLGATKTRITNQTDFLSSLMDSIDKGVGTLVDADMNQESTKLKALQTQQQLGIQALSIANSNSQSILSLFR